MTGHTTQPRAITERMKKAGSIRLIAITTYVLPNIEDRSVRFSIKEIHDLARQVLGWSTQQQHVRGALAAKKPLEFFGITWVNQEGPATQYQEVHWTWDPNHYILQALLDNDDDS